MLASGDHMKGGYRMTEEVDRAVLVYQGGIANVFAVDCWNLADYGRDARRLLQADFRTCEAYARGLQAAGVPVTSLGCNMAGDISRPRWTGDLDSLPFSDKFCPVGVTKSLDQRLSELGW